jgi:hypothetical protein
MPPLARFQKGTGEYRGGFHAEALIADAPHPPSERFEKVLGLASQGCEGWAGSNAACAKRGRLELLCLLSLSLLFEMKLLSWRRRWWQ